MLASSAPAMSALKLPGSQSALMLLSSPHLAECPRERHAVVERAL